MTDVGNHLRACNDYFIPPLNGRVEVNDYAKKITTKATKFEAWSAGKMIGLVAVYCNDHTDYIAHVTNVSVLKQWMGKGIARTLMSQAIEHLNEIGMRQINLEVAMANNAAISLYRKSGFCRCKVNGSFLTMSLFLKGCERHDNSA